MDFKELLIPDDFTKGYCIGGAAATVGAEIGFLLSRAKTEHDFQKERKALLEEIKVQKDIFWRKKDMWDWLLASMIDRTVELDDSTNGVLLQQYINDIGHYREEIISGKMMIGEYDTECEYDLLWGLKEHIEHLRHINAKVTEMIKYYCDHLVAK